MDAHITVPPHTPLHSYTPLPYTTSAKPSSRTTRPPHIHHVRNDDSIAAPRPPPKHSPRQVLPGQVSGPHIFGAVNDLKTVLGATDPPATAAAAAATGAPANARAAAAAVNAPLGTVAPTAAATAATAFHPAPARAHCVDCGHALDGSFCATTGKRHTPAVVVPTTCPDCGKEPGGKFCIATGKQHGTTAPAPAVAVPTTCPDCGNELDGKFCTVTGEQHGATAPAPAVVVPMTCPDCRQELDGLFCTVTGKQHGLPVRHANNKRPRAAILCTACDDPESRFCAVLGQQH